MVSNLESENSGIVDRIQVDGAGGIRELEVATDDHFGQGGTRLGECSSGGAGSAAQGQGSQLERAGSIVEIGGLKIAVHAAVEQRRRGVLKELNCGRATADWGSTRPCGLSVGATRKPIKDSGRGGGDVRVRPCLRL